MENSLTTAYNSIQKKFTTSEIHKILNGDDDILKCAVLLNLNEITNKETAKLIIINLTNQSGPVREICAYKISELIPKYFSFFQDECVLNIIINSFTDVNPNVARFTLNTIKYIKNKEYILLNICKKIKQLKEEVINKTHKIKYEEHVFTKKCFKIYWLLEAIKMIIFEKSDIINRCKNRESFLKILEDLYNMKEYTIREKIAQILSMLNDNYLPNIKSKLKEDRSFFVRRYGEV